MFSRREIALLMKTPGRELGNLIIQPLRRFPQLRLSPFGIPSRRVLVAEDLGQSHKVVAGIGKILMGHGVPEQVGMQVDAGDGRILVAQGPDAPIRQRPPLPDEYPAGLHRRAGLR